MFPTAESSSVDTGFDSQTNAQNVQLLKAAIHTDPNPAKGGGDILVENGALIPYGDQGVPLMDTNTKTPNGEISTYTVREGDTLSQIAQMYDVSSKTILWANNLDNPSKIRPGDTLIILPITGVRHVVKGGDTIQSIANKYKGDVEDILAYNQLASAAEVKVGDTLVIPDGTIVAAAPVQNKAAPSRVSGGAAVSSGIGSDGFVNPLPGGIKTQGIHGYNGVDIGASNGAPIHAAAAGQVIVAKGDGAWNGGYGNYVVIKHANGTQTLYAHASSLNVNVGAWVTAGQTIAYVGSTGRSTGNHLHFEVRGAKNPF